jgi:hypothetical protein
MVPLYPETRPCLLGQDAPPFNLTRSRVGPSHTYELYICDFFLSQDSRSEVSIHHFQEEELFVI